MNLTAIAISVSVAVIFTVGALFLINKTGSVIQPSPSIAPSLTPSYFPTVSPSLSPLLLPSPSIAPDETSVVPVLVLKYFPIIALSADILDTSETGDWQNPDLNALKNQVDILNQGIINALEKGSAYHGYKNASSSNYLDYQIIFEKEFLRQISKSVQYAPSADHIKELNDIKICDLVENRGVKEVWIWMTHNSTIAPIESNMAGPWGDISNSSRQSDLPVCKKTYTVYDYNYGRGVGEAIEDHNHQQEALFNYVDYDLFWNKFVNPYGKTSNIINHCGWSHFPPNASEDYDWRNKRYVLSDCENWKPDGGGEVKQINCETWSSGCIDDSGLSFKIWWMQNIPGLNNNLTYRGKNLRNWWDFVADFDKALAEGKSLLK